jgi:phage baseplate assembly protein W
MIDNSNFKGIPYPITKTPRGFFYIQGGVDQIKSDMLILLLTNPRERVMLPDFGTPLRKLLFEQNDVSIIAKAKQMIAKSLKMWEPRVAIENIYIQNKLDVSSASALEEDVNNERVLLIRITFFDRLEITKINELKLELPLGG